MVTLLMIVSIWMVMVMTMLIATAMSMLVPTSFAATLASIEIMSEQCGPAISMKSKTHPPPFRRSSNLQFHYVFMHIRLRPMCINAVQADAKCPKCLSLNA